MSDRMLFDAFLTRLGCSRENPSVASLGRLHRAYTERVPYETTWIHLGERRGIDPLASVREIVDRGRGGYCFHLNGALAALLVHLGYAVTLHSGGVHGEEPDRVDIGDHLVVLVHDLPAAGNPAGVWYVDAGLGDALHDPLPLVAGSYQQGPLPFRLRPSSDGIGDWRFERVGDLHASFPAMSFELAPVTMEVFGPAHTRLATSPDSKFVRMVTVQRRHADGSTVLRGRVLTRRTMNGVERQPVVDRQEWFALLGDEFQLPLVDHGRGADPAALDRLWAHVTSVPLPDGLVPAP